MGMEHSHGHSTTEENLGYSFNDSCLLDEDKGHFHGNRYKFVYPRSVIWNAKWISNKRKVSHRTTIGASRAILMFPLSSSQEYRPVALQPCSICGRKFNQDVLVS